MSKIASILNERLTCEVKGGHRQDIKREVLRGKERKGAGQGLGGWWDLGHGREKEATDG